MNVRVVPPGPSSCGSLRPGHCLAAALDWRWDLLSSRYWLGGEFLGVPTGLLVHKPGISRPNEHVEEAKHLTEQHRGEFIKETRGTVLSLKHPMNIQVRRQKH